MGNTARNDCPFCDVRCSTKFNLRRHVLRVHKVNLPAQGTQGKRNFKCCYCSDGYRHFEQLVTHHETVHGFPAKYETREFTSMEEFKVWKEEVEKATLTQFSASTGSRTVGGGIKKWYLRCHRSGSYVPKGTGTRKLKLQGSIKTGETCLAHMTVTKDDTRVKVKYQSLHLGHDFDLCHSSLTPTEKAGFAAQLQEGVTMDAILDSVRNDFDGTLERIHLATRKDLYNIKRDFKITCDDKLHGTDYVDVGLWVERMKKEPHNPVPFFKHQNQPDDPEILNRTESELLQEEDFLLAVMTLPQELLLEALGTDRICIDKHRTTGFDFELVTLLCIDEFGCGYPCAFCITSRTDDVAMKIFFGAIKERTGELHVKTFMSDDTSYNAWKDIMGNADQQLLCPWHVDKNWREKIRRHLKSREAQKFTYKALHKLMYQPNEDRFQELLEAFLQECATRPETEAFFNYFTSHYAGCTNMWAACYREAAGINTDTQLEAFHRALKRCYLEGKQAKRVARLIPALLRLTKNKLLDQLIKFSTTMPELRVNEITKEHEAGAGIPQEHVCSVAMHQWLVRSRSCEGASYTVTQQLETSCASSPCSFMCQKCGICIHNFTCTCIINTVRLGLCKHIHAVAAPHNSGHLAEAQLQPDQQICCSEDPMPLDLVTVDLVTSDIVTVDPVTSDIVTVNPVTSDIVTVDPVTSDIVTADAIQGNTTQARSISLAEAVLQHLQSTELDTITEKKVEAALDSILQTLTASSTDATMPLEKAAPKRKITRVASCRKKVFSASAARRIKPEHEKRSEIASVLLDQTEVHHTGFDHTYTQTNQKLISHSAF